ncbi:anaerobic ribonucleoside-triphosphate reductase [Methanolobus sp. ZRKC3]|uniref:anaerobic ribonucleoside-triphosphate reductase n=1 Tax=Methanolobus sp. ZRKC3 TaxID=3125786 RepID=UPI003247974E
MEVGEVKMEVDRLDFRDPVELVEDVLSKNSWLLKENANTRLSPSVIDLHLASQIKKRYALEKLYSKEVADVHLEGKIHIHDLHSPFKPYCNGIDARIFLMDGLKFPDTISQPAKHFHSAIYHAMSFMMHSQQFFAGAQAIDLFNWMLAPHLHYDDVSEEELFHIVQGFMFQMNQSNRIGAQSAFTNIGLRIKCPPLLAKERAVFGGKLLDETYNSFEKEARTIYRIIMEVAAQGDASDRPFTFPLITTAITKDLDPDDPLWKATMRATSSTGAPYFLNLTADYLEEETVQAMCCRLLTKHSGGIWNAGGMGTGSNKVVSINLPGIAIGSKDIDAFFENLDQAMQISRQALHEGNEIIKRALYEWKILPWLLKHTSDGTPYYNFSKRHLTFGLVGLNECLLNLTGKSLQDEQQTGMQIVQHISERIMKFSKEDGVDYTLEQTPAESTAYRFASLDRRKYGKHANTQGGDIPYYTNSTHVPYKSEISLVNRIEIEAQFHPYFTGGTICHIWMGESVPDPEGLSEFILRIAKTKLAYFCFSPDFSICKRGHTSHGKNEKCPLCSERIIDHISRVTGYYGHVSNWNPGKRKEFEERHRYNIDFAAK